MILNLPSDVDPHLWVRFLNTLSIADGVENDAFSSDGDVAAWADRILAPERSPGSEAEPKSTRGALGDARSLRHHLRTAAVAIGKGEPVPGSALTAVNEAVAGSRIRHRFEANDSDVAEVLEIEGRGVAPALTLVALSAGRFLADGDTTRLRQCASSSCILFFIDDSRNGSRRWCSMSTCGNREKVRAHYERSRRRGAR